MRHTFLLILVLIIPIHFSCNKTEVSENKEINVLIDEYPNLAPPNSPYESKVENTEVIEKVVDGIKRNCVRTTYSFCKNFEELIGANPNTQALFPGSLVKGEDVRDGLLTSISGIKRQSMNYTLVGDISSSYYPDLATVSEGVNQLVANSKKKPDAQIYFLMQEVHSTEQAINELGIDYKVLNSEIKATLNSQYSTEHSYVYMFFRQAYYEVVVEYPGQPSKFFDSEVTAEELKYQVSNTSPICYVASVKYGRAFIAQFKSSSTSKTLLKSLNLGFGNLTLNPSLEKNEVLTNTEVKLLFLGGSSEDATKAASIGTPEALFDFMKAGATPDINTRLYPISYSVRHIKDNSLVKTGNPVEYTIEECDVDPDSKTKIKLQNVNFEIIEDCDFWGSGEFYYEFTIEDQEGKKLIDLISNDKINPISASNGDIIKVDIEEPFYALNGDNYFFRISGALYQQKSDNSYEKVGDIDKKHFYPYSNLGNFTILLQSDSDCSSEFNYTLIK